MEINPEQRKILFVDHTAAIGGAELSLLDLAAAYAQTSKVLLFADGPLQNRLEKAGIPLSVVRASKDMLEIRASGGLRSLAKIPEIWRIAGLIAQEGQGYDLILANSQKAFVTCALAKLRGSPPIFWYLHDILTAKHFSQVNRAIAVFFANRFATKVLVNSQATGEAFAVAGGNKKLCHVVYNGFNSQKFDSANPQDSKKIRSELGIEDAPLVGVFSRLSYWKGQHVLLEAVKELPQVQVILVGEALFGEEDYVSQIKALANESQLQGRVHWLGFRDDIPALMKACDLIIHTSTEPEPFGRVIVEGQLAQKPVIASAAGGALELVEDGKTGLLFPPGDAIALRQQIQTLISDRTLGQTIAQQGYLNAKSNFALKTIMASFQKAIAEV